jgi:uncharacterized cysteine cluster protein YcgN (CxxCxxCC family)
MNQRWHNHINQQDWEALCDGCGLCCTHKFEDEDTGEILNTDVACKLLNLSACQCTHYESRFKHVQACLDLRQMSDEEMLWLPKTCAYRLTFEGNPLPSWHPLNSGSAESVHQAGISVRGNCVSELDIDEERLVDHIREED